MASKIQTRVRPATAKTIGFRSVLATALSVALLGAFTDSASAKKHSYKPVEKKARAFIFNPTGIEANEVRKARLKLHKGSKTVSRRVRARRVRKALKSSAERAAAPHLKVGHPGKGRGGKLEVIVDPAPAEEPPVEEPPVEEPPVEEPPVEEPPVEEPPVEEPPVEEPPVEEPPTSDDCGFGTFSAQSHPEACWRPYSDSSPFNRQVKSNAPVVSNSQAIVDRWIGFGNLNAPKFDGGTAGTSYDYEHPIYYSSPSDPVFTVQCTQWVSSCEVHGLQVRIPNQAKPAAGGDGHLSVIDQQTGWEWDFWQVTSKPSGGGTLTVSHGGRTQIDGDGLGSNATAAHFGLAAGVIRPEELRAGEINHALFMVVNCTSGTSVRPADPQSGRSCSSIGQSNTNAPRMGEHFVLDMTDAEINALPTAEWRKTILRAMARYGLYVGDTGGGFLKVQSGQSWTSFGKADPWKQLGQDLGVPTWSDSKGTFRLFDLRTTVDWRSQMKVVDPCVGMGTC